MQYPYPYPADRGPTVGGAGGQGISQQTYSSNGQDGSHLTTYGTAPQQYAYDGDRYGQQQQEEEPVKVSMVVPEGAQPGMKLTYSAPDGQELRLTVPEGVPPGSVMTLTQDPVTKQWRCMAEPADTPSPPQQSTYEPPPAQAQVREAYTAPQAAQNSLAPERVIPAQAPIIRQAELPTQHFAAASSASTATYPTGQAPTVISRTSYMQPMPVNLSYVPPPVAIGAASVQMSQMSGASVAMAPGQVAQRPGITSYQGAPATLAVDPAQFNPPRQMPEMFSQQQVYEQRPPSYTPPPMNLVQQTPSYTPPPQMTIMEQRPSYTPLPQVALPPMGIGSGMQPSMMATTAKVQPQQFTGQVMVAQTPSYVPPPVMPMVMPQNPSYVPPPVAMPSIPGVGMPSMDGASVQLPAGVPAQGPSISTLPQQQQPMQFMQPGMPMGMIPAIPGMTGPSIGMTAPAPVSQWGQPQPGFGMPPMGAGGVGLQPPSFIGVGPLAQPGYTIPGLSAPQQMGGLAPYQGMPQASPFPPQEARQMHQFGPDGMPQASISQQQLPQQPMMGPGGLLYEVGASQQQLPQQPMMGPGGGMIYGQQPGY